MHLFIFLLKFDLLKKAKIPNIIFGLLIMINMVLFLISLDFQTMQVNCGWWDEWRWFCFYYGFLFSKVCVVVIVFIYNCPTLRRCYF